MKKRLQILLPFLAIFSFLCCNSGNGRKHSQDGEITRPGKIQVSVACPMDLSNTFAVYLPSTFKPGQRYPLVMAFDPHAVGALPVKKYRDLAEKYEFILVGSNVSKNGQSQDMTENIYQSLMPAVRSFFPIDTSRIYLLGFSGGARVASLMALSHPGIRGVIGCGAGFPGTESLPEFHFEFFGIAGLGDFNLNELMRLDDFLNKTGNRHFITTFPGPHEWPPLETVEDAILWMKLKGEPGLSRPEQKILELETSRSYQKNQSYRREILKKEESIQRDLMNSLFSKDLQWWKGKISGFEAGSRPGNDPETEWMNQRLLAFLSLFCYSNANAAMNQDNRELAGKVIGIYRMSDPGNPEPEYLQALLYMRDEDTTASMAALQKAIDKGFSDKPRAIAQNEFENMKTNRRFFDLLQKMK